MTHFKTADLIDDHDARLAFCALPLRKFGRARGFHGPVATLRCFEDNALLRATVETPGEGRVLVVDAGGSTRCAVVGDQVAALAQGNGWAGLVLNGAIRDVEEIGAMEYAVFAIGHSPKKSARTGAGERGAVLRFGDAVFRPGAWLYADADGVLVADAPVHGEAAGATRR